MAAPGALPATVWRVRGRVFDLARPVVMGILNVTPDSFYGPSRAVGLQAAVDHAALLADEGADLIDIGGESTRPGASPVSEGEELRRVLPVVERFASRVSPAISIDTMKPGVARAALAAGAHVINDITALQADGMAAAAVEHKAGVILMHMHGTPATMQASPLGAAEVVEAVMTFLRARVAAAEHAGIRRDQIAVDPGFGFGKTAEANEEVLRSLGVVAGLGLAVAVGVSRKRFIGQRTGQEAEGRLAGSLAAQVVAFACGARIFRTHDVRATRDALAVAAAL